MVLVANNSRIRKNFGRIKPIMETPNLIEIQKKSYADFLQLDKRPEERENIGLQRVFHSVFPIRDFNKTSSLEFVSYSLDKPKYDVAESLKRGMTFAAPLKVVIRLVVWDINEDTGAQSIRDVKEQEIYFGEIPIMTETGTFIVNGTERVVVSQLHRSPGVFFDHDKGKSHSSGKQLYNARIIPYRGSWIDFEFDHKDIVHVRIDRRRKFPATIFLKALGYSEEELLNFFYLSEHVVLEDDGTLRKSIVPDLLEGQTNQIDIVDQASGKVLFKKGKKFTRKTSIPRLLEAGLEYIPVLPETVIGQVVAYDVVDESTGEVVVQCNEELTEAKIEELRQRGIREFDVFYIDNYNISSSFRDTLLIDKVSTTAEAVMDIYKRMRPGEPPTMDMARHYLENLCFNPERYDLSKVGRLKLNHKFGFEDVPLELQILRKDDILAVLKYLLELKDGKHDIDDIDHLGNRRVRSVGELVENHYRIGLVRMERAIKERMTLQEVDTLMPHELVNAKPVQAVVKEFFGSSQLSQFMDQTNPLSEITHKRRLSALGPGGMTRERAGFEVRDVHSTHYGRVCPIETPEGPNIGLIASLSSYARVNDYGFIETPYRTVENGRLTDEVKFYTALDEEKHIIAQANAEVDKDGKFVDEYISARRRGDFIMPRPDEISLMDVSPNQLVSIAASLIPFLENDDANRALMGSNMQRQAVPLLSTSAPLVGTGVERKVVQDSGVTVVATEDGVVESVDATRIVIRATSSENEGPGVHIYNLLKYKRSNQNTCINQKPIVKKGDAVKKGDIIADGPGTDTGELALGRNVLVAFMPWGGYNFEDSILMSERITKRDIFTSIHIEEFECLARDTKLGKEEITRDIPNVGDEAMRDVDETGIVRIGAEVKPGDILVCKITPKGETQLSPEEKLLRAIFGEKAGDVRDTSLRVPPGVAGTIIDTVIYSREGVEKDARTREIEELEIQKYMNDMEDEIRIIKEGAYDRIRGLLVGQTTASRIIDEDTGEVLLEAGVKLDAKTLQRISPSRFYQITLEDGVDIEEKINRILIRMNESVNGVRTDFNEKIDRLQRGDELPPGVIKMVKVYVATKRKLQVGDKMAGRHGNKGVVSMILPEESLPFMEDGTPLDLVLNPLGVPSRMNVGQILETHLGWAAYGLGQQIQRFIDENYSPDKLKKFLLKVYEGDAKLLKEIKAADDETVRALCRKLAAGGVHMATPVFDGAKEEQIFDLLKTSGLPDSGQTRLRDGRTGELFHFPVTVGIIYMLKLHHLVDDKIHARSIGPYSLVTQQPLGGKAQFGGQRLGEMEVWALEAYGAAYTLQEFLTVKSDDIYGRTKMYETIVKGETNTTIGLPESFNVLVKELKSLALDVDLIETNPSH